MNSVDTVAISSSPKRAIQLLVSVVISAGALWWALSALEWNVVLERFESIHLWILIPSLALFLLHFVLRAYRWKLLLPPVDPEPSLRNLFDALLIGGFASYILPLRAGEFVRPAMLCMQSRHRFGSCFASVVIERFFDLSMVLLSFIPLAFLLPGIPEWAFRGVLALSTVAAGILLFMLGGVILPEKLRALIEWCSDLGQRLKIPLVNMFRRFLLDLLDGTAVIGSVNRLAAVAGLSVIVWATCYAQFWVWLYFFDGAWSPLLGIATGVVVALAVAAPSAPGFIGVYQFGCAAAFALFPGLTKEDAAAYSIVTHALQYIMICGYGAYALIRNNVRLSDLKKAPE